MRILECRPEAYLRHLLVHGPKDSFEAFGVVVPFLTVNNNRKSVGFPLVIGLLDAVWGLIFRC